MDPITTVASATIKHAASEVGKGAIKEVSKNSITALKNSVARNEVLSPIKTKEVTELIKTRQASQPTIGTKARIERIKTINRNLNGSIHQPTGIKFRTKQVITGEGKIVEGKFPNFNPVSVHNSTLPEHLIKASNKSDIIKQNKFCTSEFRKEFIKNQDHYIARFRELNKQLIKDKANLSHGRVLNMEEIIEKQKKDILNPTGAEGGNIYGFTWHHHEKIGKMQLVPVGIHDKVRHTGGYSIWCKSSK